MSTIQENLQTIADSTAAIKQAIIDKGGTVGDITTWADAISGISGGGGESENNITLSGTISRTNRRAQISGTLYPLPDNCIRGYLVAISHNGSVIVTASTYVNPSDPTISFSLNFDEIVDPKTSIVLVFMYALEGDVFGTFRVKLVDVFDQSGSGSSDN